MGQAFVYTVVVPVFRYLESGNGWNGTWCALVVGRGRGTEGLRKEGDIAQTQLKFERTT